MSSVFVASIRHIEVLLALMLFNKEVLRLISPPRVTQRQTTSAYHLGFRSLKPRRLLLSMANVSSIHHIQSPNKTVYLKYKSIFR